VRVRDAVTGALDSMTLAELMPPPPVTSDDFQGATIPS